MDQFLEHLIDIGIGKVIRIGGQSKSQVLQGKNLRLASKLETKTKHENYLIGNSHLEMEKQGASMHDALAKLHTIHSRADWDSLEDYLKLHHPDIHSQFSRVDEEGYEIVGEHPFNFWVKALSRITSEPFDNDDEREELLTIASKDIKILPILDQRRLLDDWIRQCQSEHFSDLTNYHGGVEKLREEIEDVYREVDRRVLETADVIGVTTTGLAKKIKTLQHVNSKVLVVEEAGEIMEPHMLSALLPSIEHASKHLSIF